MANRDPRIDPQPGDVLARQGRDYKTLRRSVVWRRLERVRFKSGDSATEREVYLVSWMEWSREADIIRTAEHTT